LSTTLAVLVGALLFLGVVPAPIVVSERAFIPFRLRQL